MALGPLGWALVTWVAGWAAVARWGLPAVITIIIIIISSSSSSSSSKSSSWAQ